MAETTASQGSALLGGLDVHWLEWGPTDGRIALALHGFPDSAHTWRHLGPALAADGWRVVAPFLRGYAPSAIPSDGDYHLHALVGDARALADHLGASDPVLIGHDWGAIIGYAAVASEPDRYERLVTLAVPPLATVMAGFMTFEQIRRSWYMFVFQHPLAEGIVAADDLRFIDELWAEWSPGYDASEDLPLVHDAIGAPENLAAAISYYRAMLGTDSPEAQNQVDAAVFEPSPVPTLYIHGADDGCMGAELVGSAMDSLPTRGSRTEIVDGVGHFSHLENPSRVNALITDFLAG